MLNIDLTDVLKNADPAEIAVAIKSAYGMHGIRTISDMWDNAALDLHKLPSSHEIPSGPAMTSSGAGAESAVSSYSNPAAQMGLMEKYREFEGLISGFQDKLSNVGKSHDAVKANVEKLEEAVGNILAVQKRKMEEDEVVKAKKDKEHSEKMEKLKMKARKKMVKSHLSLAELTAAVQKAAEFEAVDPALIAKAKKYMIKASTSSDAFIESDAKGIIEKAIKASIKTQKSLKKAWAALIKAERPALAAHGLHGYGNQKDEAEPDSGHEKVEGEAAKSFLKGSIKEVALGGLRLLSEIKANGGTLPGTVKADEVPAAIKAEEKKEEEKKEEKHEEKKEEHEPEKKAEAPKEDPFKKAVVERLAALENKAASTPNKPNIIPVILKSGIQSDGLMKVWVERLMEASKEHTMSDEGIAKARNLLDRFRAAAKGRLEISNVQLQLEKSDDEVRNFFYVTEKDIMTSNS